MMSPSLDPERAEVDALARWMPAGGRLVDIGCGDGRLTRRLLGWTDRAVGIDPEPLAIRFASVSVPRARFAVASGEALPFGSEVFDVAVLSWSL